MGGVTETRQAAPPHPAAPGPAGDGAVGDGAVGDGAPRRPALSPSRAADFKQCPLLYRLRAIDRLPEAPTPAQVRGTLVHAVLDRLYALPAAERVPAAARALVAPVGAELCAADPELAAVLPAVLTTAPDGHAEVDRLLDAYFALEDPRLLEPEAREQLVEVERESGVPLRGYVDRVDSLAGGGYRLVDYKTGAAPGPAHEGRALFQMKFYALVLLLLRGRAPRELHLLYLNGPLALRFTPDEEQLRRFGRTLDALWAAIRAAGATGEFRPNPGPLCASCTHRVRCPAWDGVPPPYPGWPEPG